MLEGFKLYINSKMERLLYRQYLRNGYFKGYPIFEPYDFILKTISIQGNYFENI